MKTIDNKGRGNCMYYAYAISLMYHLRAQDYDTVTKILGRLNLTPVQHKKILAILDHNQNLTNPFDTHDTSTIQEILGPACRGLASRAVRKEFVANPADTALYSASAYQFFEHFSKYLSPTYRRYIEPRVDVLGNYGKAEIFKVPGMRASMQEYAKRVSKEVEKEFACDWGKIKKNFKPSEYAKEKSKLIEAIIAKTTIRFLQNQQCTNLDRYIRHLNTDTTWGSEETLLTLNRALSNEQALYDPASQQWSFTSDTPINLAMAVNGEIMSGVSQTESEKPHIILNNRSLTHWVSIIPEPYLADNRFSLKYLYQQFTNFIGNQQVKPSQGPEKAIHKKPTPPAPTTQSVMSKEEKMLGEKLTQIIKNPGIRAEYQAKLLELINKPSGIKSLSKAKANKGESDEEFAERLQAAEVRSLLRRK